MARRSLKNVKERLKKEASRSEGSNTGGFFYPHWKLPNKGETSIRVVEDPDMENDLITYIDYLEHKLFIDGNMVRIPCIKNLGKDYNCPICEHSSKLYSAGDKEGGKKYYREKFALLRAIVTKDGLEYTEDETPATGQLRTFKFSYQLANAYKIEMGKLDDDEEFWNLEDGTDFVIVKTVQKSPDGEYGKYDVASGFARRPSDVSKYEDQVTDEPLSVLIPPIPSYDEAAEKLEQHFKALYNDGPSSGGSSSKPEREVDRSKLMDDIEKNRSSRREKVEETPEDDDNIASDFLDSLDDDDDDEDLMARLAED